MSGLAAFFKPVLDWAYTRPYLFPRTIDLLIWPIALVLGAILKLVFSVASTGLELLVVCAVAVTLQALLGWAIGLYKHRWRVASFDEVMALGAVWSSVTITLVLGNYAARQAAITDLPTTAVSIGALTAWCCSVLFAPYGVVTGRRTGDLSPRTASARSCLVPVRAALK